MKKGFLAGVLTLAISATLAPIKTAEAWSSIIAFGRPGEVPAEAWRNWGSKERLVAKAILGDQNALSKVESFHPTSERAAKSWVRAIAAVSNIPTLDDADLQTLDNWYWRAISSAIKIEPADARVAIDYLGFDIRKSQQLLDPERNQMGKIEFETTSGSIYEKVNQTNPQRVYRPNTITSAERMARGLPPIGNDGKPVQICRLLDSPLAPYFELSYYDAYRLVVEFGGNSSTTRNCLNPNALEKYWRSRLDDFPHYAQQYAKTVAAHNAVDIKAIEVSPGKNNLRNNAEESPGGAVEAPRSGIQVFQ